MKRAFVFFLLLTSLARPVAADHSVRTWTSTDGKTIEASLVQADRTSVILKLKNGHEATVPVERLGESDRLHLEDLRKTGGNLRIGTMPAESKIDATVAIEGGPTTSTTPNFTFDCEQEVTKAFISEAARVFEGTLEAVRSLPLGLDPKPAEGEKSFRTRFLDRATFEIEFNRVREGEGESSGGNGPAATRPGRGTADVANVAGVYLPARKEVLVPFTSLGVNMSGSKVSLRKSSDTSTLIHEVTHQVMHDWLVATPLWVGEGLAEYLSAVPYQNGRFEFKNAAAGLKETLLEDYRLGEGQAVRMYRPSRFIASSNADWTGVPEDYLSALMLAYYLIHLDQPSKPCASLAAYLSLLKESQAETESFISDYNRAVKEFEEKRLAYNREVEAFNASLTAFKAEVTAYNDRVRLYNTQLGSGVPENERIEVGREPVEPKPPKDLTVPEILRENSSTDGKPIDFLAKIRGKAVPALLRGRSGETFDEAVVAGFEAVGIRVELIHFRTNDSNGLGSRPIELEIP
jgi:hypothetical protein